MATTSISFGNIVSLWFNFYKVFRRDYVIIKIMMKFVSRWWNLKGTIFFFLSLSRCVISYVFPNLLVFGEDQIELKLLYFLFLWIFQLFQIDFDFWGEHLMNAPWAIVVPGAVIENHWKCCPQNLKIKKNIVIIHDHSIIRHLFVVYRCSNAHQFKFIVLYLSCSVRPKLTQVYLAKNMGLSLAASDR